VRELGRSRLPLPRLPTVQLVAREGQLLHGGDEARRDGAHLFLFGRGEVPRDELVRLKPRYLMPPHAGSRRVLHELVDQQDRRLELCPIAEQLGDFGSSDRRRIYRGRGALGPIEPPAVTPDDNGAVLRPRPGATYPCPRALAFLRIAHPVSILSVAGWQ
jgi:hypothetical protein